MNYFVGYADILGVLGAFVAIAHMSQGVFFIYFNRSRHSCRLEYW